MVARLRRRSAAATASLTAWRKGNGCPFLAVRGRLRLGPVHVVEPSLFPLAYGSFAAYESAHSFRRP